MDFGLPEYHVRKTLSHMGREAALHYLLEHVDSLGPEPAQQEAYAPPVAPIPAAFAPPQGAAAPSRVQYDPLRSVAPPQAPLHVAPTYAPLDAAPPPVMPPPRDQAAREGAGGGAAGGGGGGDRTATVEAIVRIIGIEGKLMGIHLSDSLYKDVPSAKAEIKAAGGFKRFCEKHSDILKFCEVRTKGRISLTA